MLILLNAFLWRLGGAGCPPFGRYWRRAGYPMLALAMYLSTGISPLIAILGAFLCFLTTTLPLTFFGDSIHKHWFNWVWVWIAGYIVGLPSVVPLGWHGFSFALIPMFAQGLSVTLSNIPGWPAKTFKHSFCEAVTGASIGMMF